MPASHVERLEPGRLPLRRALRELLASRELVFFLAQSDFKVRYRQALLGVAWALIQPAVTMLIFSLFLGRLTSLPPGVPYAAFALAALVPWTFFANSTASASGSLVTNGGMLSKVYFPRLSLPLAPIVTGLADLALGLGLLVVVVSAYGFAPGPRLVAVLGASALAAVSACGAGTLLAALSVEYRDFRYVVPFMLQAWLFATPIAYPIESLSDPWRTLVGLNPMTGVVVAYQWAFLGTGSGLGGTVLLSTASAIALLLVGISYFHSRESVFADVV